jgi:ribulose-5-phosphate 4-epimerase/fuculose-1-phosphate aldolase
MTSAPEALLDDLVAANRILAGLGIVDGFGHVSVRHPERPDRYLLSRSLAPERVTRDDIMTFDLAGDAQDGDQRAPYLERFIHGADPGEAALADATNRRAIARPWELWRAKFGAGSAS